MERFFGELGSESNKIDLTLKLSPCGVGVGIPGGGEEGEDKQQQSGLKRSSSLVLENGLKWGPFVSQPPPSSCSSLLERSCSLPSPEVANNNNKRMLLQGSGSARIDLAEGGVHSKQENVSLASKKTTRPPLTAGTRAAEEEEAPEAKRFKLGNYCSLKGDVMEILRQMPSVTTTGDGPNGKRIEGFLYKYMTGQVCIVCVCHGSFLTPAEFIVHAGGKEVDNPMKHITVYTNPF